MENAQLNLVEGDQRKTLKTKVSFKGKAPFLENVETTIILKPGHSGIRFTVPFEDTRVTIPVDSKHTKSAGDEHTTLVANSKGEVKTVEHLLSALVGMGISDCEIELFGSNQVPMDDASAEGFVKLIEKAGIKEIGGKRRCLKVERDIFFYKEGSLAILRPYNGFKISALIQFPDLIGEQYFSYIQSPKNYKNEISWARSFIRRSCDLKVWQLCRKAIPALPEDRRNSPVLVFEGSKWIVAPKKKDEPVRHKILDAIGDLRTLGSELLADVTLIRPGHDFNRELVNYISSLYKDC